ncbi:ferritin family protein [Candidatus Margulisiibacteriota bacterium]
MSKIFYPSELIKFAIEKEQQSYDMYKNLSEHVKNREVKEVCKLLMEQELNHEKFYEDLLNKIEDKQSPGVHEDNEYKEYMKVMIEESRVKEKEIIKFKLNYDQDFTTGKIKEILDYAIEREKDSILFYVGLKPMVDKSFYDQIDHIISEEGNHIVMINNLKHVLKV